MKHRSFERGVCSEFSCALLREWPVGTDLSQVSGLRWRSEPANFVIEGEPDLSTLGSAEKATQPDLQVSSSCLPEYRKYLFYLGSFHWAPWGAMGWCQGSHIPTSWTVTNKPQTETSSQRLAACLSKCPFHPEIVPSIQMFIHFGGETIQKAIHERGKKKDDHHCFSIDLEATANAVMRKEK